MNAEIRTEASQFPFWEYFFSNFRYSVFAVQEFLGKQDWPDKEFGKRITGGRYRYNPKFHGHRSLIEFSLSAFD
jgi:hypothetical protein